MKSSYFVAALALLLVPLQAVNAQTLNATSVNVQATEQNLLSLIPQPVLDPTLYPDGQFKNVIPQQFDPGKTYLVQASWLNSIGCPTAATIALPNADFTGVGSYAPYADPACPTGDPTDQRNMGLLLAKTGPTANFASATAELVNVKGMIVTELGYDIRKSGGSGASPLGSHCGAGAPRFDVVTQDGAVHFIGCNSPPGVVESFSNGWVRLRWSAATAFPPIVGPVQRIVIVFDEGQDTGPDFFGAAILDNIEVNGQMVGAGPVNAK